MQIVLDTSTSRIDWAAQGVDAIAQNCLTLIKTMQYEVAYDRTLGISPYFVDMPLEESIALVTAEIYRVIAEREPRATVEDVQFIGMDVEGQLNFKVVINI